MMDSFAVGFWAAVFRVLSWPSLFALCRYIAPNLTNSYGFVDCWALVHLVLAASCLVFSGQAGVAVWEWLLLAYAAVRVFEVTVYQVNVLLFDEYRARRAGRDYAVRGYRRLVVLAVQNYLEVLFWFAFAYRSLHLWFRSSEIELDSVIGAVYFAVVTVATLGYGDITPASPEGAVLVIVQSVIGAFMTLMILARFIAILRAPASLDPFELEAKSDRPLQPASDVHTPT